MHGNFAERVGLSFPGQQLWQRKGLASPMGDPRNAGTPPLRVAIVEDDQSQARLLSHWLRRGGHHSHHFDRGGAVIRALNDDSFDALVLDWNLQDMSGLEVIIKDVFRQYPHIGQVLPALGYNSSQLQALQATINGADADVVVAATPLDLARLIRVNKSVVRARYEFVEAGEPMLGSLVDEFLVRVPSKQDQAGK